MPNGALILRENQLVRISYMSILNAPVGIYQKLQNQSRVVYTYFMSKKERSARIIIFWLPVILWMGLIYFLSSFHKLQVSQVGWQDFITRKFAHITEYVVLCILIFRSLKNTTKLSYFNSVFIAFFLTLGYAVTDEYHQTLVSGRTGRPFDVGIDSLGAFIGYLFVWKIIGILPKKFQNYLRRLSL